MIDPGRLPANAVHAARLVWDTADGSSPLDRLDQYAVAAFVEALLADDNAMGRALFAWDLPRTPAHRAAMRGALLAAVQEDR